MDFDRAREQKRRKGAASAEAGTKNGEPASIKPHVGRPASYNEQVQEFICLMVARGFSLEVIAAKYPDDVPSASTMRRWLWDANFGHHAVFSAAYHAARSAYRDLKETESLVPYDADAARRPAHYTPALAQTICRQLADGKTLAEICQDEVMPAYSTVQGWLSDVDAPWNADFRKKFDQGRRALADFLADQVVLRSRQGASKSEISSLMWASSKHAPDYYGEARAPTAAPASAPTKDARGNGTAPHILIQMIMGNPALRQAAAQIADAMRDETALPPKKVEEPSE